ncbi:MAG: hypothetical protein ABJB74_01795 [Gemmatimonas sp.]
MYRSVIMRTRRSKHLSRFIVFFALLHTLVPGMAAIVDALAERDAVRVVQVGEQGSPNFRAAHPDDCALCAATAAITGTGEQRAPLPTLQLARQTPVEYRTARRPNVARPIASQRAPPAVLS